MQRSLKHAAAYRKSRVFRRSTWIFDNRDRLPCNDASVMREPAPTPEEVAGVRAQVEWLGSFPDAKLAIVRAHVLADFATVESLDELEREIGAGLEVAESAHERSLVLECAAVARRSGRGTDEIVARLAAALWKELRDGDLSDDDRISACVALCLARLNAPDLFVSMRGLPTATELADLAIATIDRGAILPPEVALAGAYAALVEDGDVERCIRHVEYARRC